MKYEVIIYFISLLTTAFALSGVNFDSIMKRNKPYEARALVIVITCVLGYLLGTFIITFLGLSKII